MLIKTDDITSLILAGGKSTRMGGIDKGLIEINGELIIKNLSMLASKYSHSVFINANRNIDKYKRLGFSVIEDSLKNFQGPLSGIYSGLCQMKTKYLLTLPCDGPLICDEYFDRMLRNCGSKINCAFSNSRLQPVYALIHKSCKTNLEKFLNDGERKIDKWYTQENFQIIDFSDLPEMFININNEEEMLKYKNRILEKIKHDK